MRGSRIMSFRSKHYPQSPSAFRIRQEFALRYYAGLLFVVMVGIMLRVSYGKEALIFGLVGIVGAILLGSVLAKVQLRRSIAEVFFINDGFSIINIDDILNRSPKRSFPLRFADPTRNEDQIFFNFEDQIITLKREDWGTDFDLIWNWLTQDLRQYQMVPQREDSDSEEAAAEGLDAGEDVGPEDGAGLESPDQPKA